MNYTIANIVITQTSDYMDEYIEHYKSLGFTKMYIGCTTQSAFEELSKLDDEFIEVIDYVEETMLQMQHHLPPDASKYQFPVHVQLRFEQKMLRKFHMLYDFITCLDTDEYLEIECKNLQTFLHSIKDNMITHIPWNIPFNLCKLYTNQEIEYKKLKSFIPQLSFPGKYVVKCILNMHKFDITAYDCMHMGSKKITNIYDVHLKFEKNIDAFINHLQTGRSFESFCKHKLTSMFYHDPHTYNYKCFEYFFRRQQSDNFNYKFIMAYDQFAEKYNFNKNMCWSTNINYTHLYQQIQNRKKYGIMDTVGVTVVSCLIPVGNVKAEYLKESIQSILNQSYKFFELIICNDWPDNTTTDDVVKSFNDKRIIYIKNEKNIGVAATRNKLKSLAIGEYIAIMDADDISNRYRFEKEVNFLQENRDIDLVSSYVYMPTGKWHQQHTKTPEEISTCLLLGGNTVSNQAAMFRQKPFENIWYDESLKTCDDFDFWITAIEQGCKFAIIPENLVTYRVQENSISTNEKQNIKDTNYIVKKHISKVVDLSKYKSDVIENFRGCGYIKRKVYKWELDELNDLIDKLVNAYDVDINWVNKYVRNGPMFKGENILVETHQQLCNIFLI